MIARLLTIAMLLAPLLVWANPCSWATPGANRYTGSIYHAVMSYEDIPPLTRWFLAIKASDIKQATDRVEISNRTITGKHVYIDARDMFFGNSLRCRRFDRTMWPDHHREMAYVFTFGGYSVGLPDVCGNVFRLDMARPVARATPATNRALEPSSLALAGIALAGLLLARRKC